jgi:hypothetical protein
MIKYLLRNKYGLCRLKLLLQLVVETSSLWHYVFRSLVPISVHSGSGPCTYAMSCIRTSMQLAPFVLTFKA